MLRFLRRLIEDTRPEPMLSDVLAETRTKLAQDEDIKPPRVIYAKHARQAPRHTATVRPFKTKGSR